MVFCDDCGHELKPTAKFCTNCGTKINEIPEKEKPSISQEDFIKKYYGDKIFDRIDEILKSSEIGLYDIAIDEKYIKSIYEKLKKKKEIEVDEIQYLMDCSEELDKKEGKGTTSQDTGQPTTESKDWRVRQTQPDETDTQYEATMRAGFGHTKKQSGKFKKFAIVCGIFMVALVILAGFGSSNDATSGTPADPTSTYQPPTLDTKKEFDPLIVASARENIPQMQELSKFVLKECRDVNSYSDYRVFALAVAADEGTLIETIYSIAEVLAILEKNGYDEHPEVGPLIKETKSLSLEASYCIDDLLMRYGN